MILIKIHQCAHDHVAENEDAANAQQEEGVGQLAVEARIELLLALPRLQRQPLVILCRRRPNAAAKVGMTTIVMVTRTTAVMITK